MAPGTPFGAEFGFIDGDRRHRLVELHSPTGALESLVLIREFRSGSDARERPALELEALLGRWNGQATTITADWPDPEIASCGLQITGGEGQPFRITTQWGSGPEESVGEHQRLLLQPDSGYCLAPLQVSHRQTFAVEAGWLPAQDRLERLIRRYDASGAWISASHVRVTRETGALPHGHKEEVRTGGS